MDPRLRQISEIHQDLLSLEPAITSGTLTEDDLTDLRTRLHTLRSDDDPYILHLADLAKHLHAGMTVRELHTVCVPVERALNRSVRDDQFLVTSEDVAKERTAYPLCLVVDHWRSAFNVGSLFRTADGLGVEKIYLTGYTPTPEQDAIIKTALGAEKTVPWEHAERTEELLKRLKLDGHRIIGFETGPEAVPLNKIFPHTPTVFVLGNERFGLSSSVLELCDEVRALAMHGLKNSMNAGVFAGIAIYEWTRQWQASS